MANDGTPATPAPQGNAGDEPQGATNPSTTPPNDGAASAQEPAPQGNQGGGQGEPRKYAGMYDSVEELEGGYKSLQTELNEVKESVKELKQGQTQQPPQGEAADPEYQAATQFVDERVKAQVSPVLDKLDEQALRQSDAKFDELKPRIDELRNEFPGISLPRAHQLARNESLARVAQNAVTETPGEGAPSESDVQQASSNASQTSTQPQGSQGVTPQDVMNMNPDEYNKFITSDAGQEYLNRRASGEI